MFKLAQRSLLKLSPLEPSIKLIDSLATQSVLSSSTTPLYTAFLNSKGRIVVDSFLHFYNNSIYLESDKKSEIWLQSHLSRYNLRKSIEISGAEPSLKVAWSSTEQEGLKKDPRSLKMGFRGLSDRNDLIDGTEVYLQRRILEGIPEGFLDFPGLKSLPLEMNLDYLNGVDFQKGCYLGQELTVRVKHTGIVRKRVVKISALDGFATLASGYQITSGGKMVGNSLSCLSSRGLAFLRLENVDSPDLELVYGNGEQSVKLLAELPEYLKLD